MKRAQCWLRVEEHFAHLVKLQSAEEKENAVTKDKGKEKANKKRAFERQATSRKDLLRHLGRKLFVLESEETILRISWKITFDWTGEAQSTVSVMAAFPPTCKLHNPMFS